MGRQDILIDEIKVERHFLMKPYECDVKKLGCASLCCMRGCIITTREAERLYPHLPSILSYLSPKRQAIIERNGTYLADCEKQCPGGCEILPEEKKAVSGILEKREKLKCVAYDEEGCLFLYDRDGMKLCAIHSYALDKGLELADVKPLDCLQYPIYKSPSKKMKKLAVQKNSLISNFPCMNIKTGEAMYKNLMHATKNLFGEGFHKKLSEYAEKGQRDMFVR